MTRRGQRRGAVLLLPALLAACAHPRPALRSPVAIPANAIRATDHDELDARASAASSSFVRATVAAMTGRERPPQCSLPALATPLRTNGPVRFLVLSGGSLNGAFGAGFYLGMQEAGHLPDEPDVVTGVSTGSLQSTFLFLARQPVPGDRDYSWKAGLATTQTGGLPPLAAGRSNVEDLALAYSISREAQILKPVPLGGIGLLLNGTKGSLDPLRRRLMGLISPETIHAVAVQACRGRKLFVGVANVDDGQGYALDLTALALRAYDGNATPALMTLVRKAYVESLIASSSVPVGAKPVSLRIRDFDRPLDAQHRRNLFVDGGARFGVFLNDIDAANRAGQAAGMQLGGVSLVVNTRLSIKPWHAGDLRNPKQGWLLIKLGLRTVDILENQVYRLSVEAVEKSAGMLGGLHMAYISNQNIAGGEEPEEHAYQGSSCGEWHDRDEAAVHPIQFYPNYMACLIDYGRTRGRQAQWNLVR